MNDDSALLLRYADFGSEAAFAEVVRRHVDLVYAVALRRTDGASDLAADVAQIVFTQLARKARTLSTHPALAAWLHTASRYAAATLMTSEHRRKHRERAAVELTYAGDNAPAWEQLRPVLDAAIDELPENDRTAVVLRFLEKRPFAEIGAALRVSEDAARVRTDRALDKLRASLGRRGITSSAAAFGAIIGAQPAIAAPAGLAATLASAATAAAGSGLAGLSLFMSTKLITTGAVCALLAFGLGTYFGIHRTLAATQVPAAVPDDARTIASLRASNNQLKAEIDRLKAEASRLGVPASKSPAAPNGVAAAAARPTQTEQQLHKAVLNNLRQLASAADQFYLENGKSVAAYEDLVGPTKYVKQLNPLDGENYAALAFQQGRLLTVTTQRGVPLTYDPSAPPSAEEREEQQLRNRATQHYGRAVEAYFAAHPGQAAPSDHAAVLSYFNTPQQAAEFQQVYASLPENERNARFPSPAEAQRAERIDASITRALEAFRAARGANARPTNREFLLPYFATPQEAADYLEFIDVRK